MTSNENVEQWCNKLNLKNHNLHGYLSAINQYTSKESGLGIPPKHWKNIINAFKFISNAEWEPHNDRGMLPVVKSYYVPSYEQAAKNIRNTGTANVTVGDAICLLPMYHQAQAMCHRSDDHKIKLAPSSVSVPTDIDNAHHELMFPATFEKSLYQNKLIPDAITNLLCRLTEYTNSTESFRTKTLDELDLSNFLTHKQY